MKTLMKKIRHHRQSILQFEPLFYVFVELKIFSCFSRDGSKRQLITLTGAYANFL